MTQQEKENYLCTRQEAVSLIESAPVKEISVHIRLSIFRVNGNRIETATWVDLTKRAAMELVGRMLNDIDEAAGIRIPIAVSRYKDETYYWIG